MDIFIGSSSKHLNIAKVIAQVIEEHGHKPLLWRKLFKPTDITFEKIMDMCNQVHGGIFILAPDDEIVSDKGSEFVPRDNVLIEAGIMFGKFGVPHVALCKVGNTKLASDWAGITYILYEPEKMFTLENEILRWLCMVEQSVANKNKSINDFLLDKLPDFEELISSAKEEIMISSFFISIFQTSKALRDAINKGIAVRLLLSDFRGECLMATSIMLDGIKTDGRRVAAKLKSTLMEFAVLHENGEFPKNLEIRFIDCVFPTRTTILDSHLDSGHIYVHISSYKNKVAVQPTFHLLKNEYWFEVYRQEFERIWQDARPLDFDELKLL